MAQTTADRKDEAFIKAMAAEFAKATGLEIQEAMSRVKGVVTRRPKDPRTWPKEPIPDKCEAGYAVICDPKGKKYRKVECFHVMAASKGGFANTLEGMKNEMTLGALWQQIASGQMIVAQLTPYKSRRDDGVKILPRGGSYPVDESFEIYEGTYYHPIFGRDFLSRARSAKGRTNAEVN